MAGGKKRQPTPNEKKSGKLNFVSPPPYCSKRRYWSIPSLLRPMTIPVAQPDCKRRFSRRERSYESFSHSGIQLSWIMLMTRGEQRRHSFPPRFFRVSCREAKRAFSLRGTHIAYSFQTKNDLGDLKKNLQIHVSVAESAIDAPICGSCRLAEIAI